MNTPGVASLERHNDTFIMDRVLEAEKFTNHEIQRINYCRLYLGALTLADLATTSGDRLDQAKLAGNPSLVSTVPKWMRVHQDKPSDDTWKLWKQANALWSLPDGTLAQTLGPWLLSNADSRISHLAYATRSLLFVRKANGEYLQCHRVTEKHYVESNHQIDEQQIPKEATPVEVKAATQSLRWTIVRRTLHNIP